eukprot:CAMPEP_0114353056 /NCGR_PEP_ID=MMETSP0101-20121206/18384_1 /TAXON_ID=38822 ORGANISM="Pteridomonas danica, Strain PT" /NCGR_SAMPLE_ID=MMETSP0101 /ASSEMBLY_ACC=CAM_ASM_000211 /LENGTH=86 /DNA_ID=CAMNT_0001493715 /DNA_START=3061 /DNA_END=3317 /DNA_ORIENTATION=-
MVISKKMLRNLKKKAYDEERRFENSARRRTNALREYDQRRKLQAEGKLQSLPLIIDDYDDLKEGAQELEKAYDNERRLFATPPSAT